MGKLLLQLRKENMQAMKEKDTLKKGVLSLVISAIALAEKEKGETLSEADELVYVQKELKQTKDALASTPSSRQDLIDECNRKIAAIELIFSEKGLERSKKSQGVIMKEMMAKYKGQVDGKLVSKVLGEILNG